MIYIFELPVYIYDIFTFVYFLTRHRLLVVCVKQQFDKGCSFDITYQQHLSDSLSVLSVYSSLEATIIVKLHCLVKIALNYFFVS